jgi:hypothetical protein
MSLNVFFRHLGSKYLTGAHYPPPLHDTIIEPFAGGAGYSVRYHRKRVILVERDPEVARVWRYLIGVSARELLALPDLPKGGTLDDVRCSADARALISRNLNRASGPTKRYSAWLEGNQHNLWGPTLRARLAAQVEKIRHWRVIEGDYTLAPDIVASWFVDPPYQRMHTRMYAHDADRVDFTALGAWCKARRGQIVVCENERADWLPFRSFGNRMAAVRGGARDNDGFSREVIWTNDETQKEAPEQEQASQRRRAAR